MKNKLKELSMKGWIATILMFSSLFMIWYTYGKTDLCEVFSYFAVFGFLGIVFDGYSNGDEPLIYIGTNKKEDKNKTNE